MFFDYDEFVIQTFQFANRYEWTNKGLVLKFDNIFLAAALISNNPVTLPITPGTVTPPVVVTPPVPVITYIPEVVQPVVIPTPIWTPVVEPPKPVTPPVVVLPGVSFFSLKGIYRLELVQSSLSTILLTFDE